ncbi:amino acid ABC transporter membrane protein 2, PAAT family [Halogranum gelatinilyticum]|uniref:Amino acid ABC transporter membrane protein 2, PAAT family n=1 Tax=Halogranum gelatinilyticum TaxID=660521 RepID=A0A1G9TK79_9EURY|nr:amino acid ABC transporter permease [Halogranum gelatinilyticum]SDM47824.1 amino acid ABC transporter membrane protein 2, PAAT family [Halogranum gelatinilyticum]
MSQPTVDRGTESTSFLGGRSVGRVAMLVGGVVFWSWLVLRWVNDWTGGLLVPADQPFVDPATLEALGAGVPLVGGVFDAAAFATTYLPNLASGLWLTVVLTVTSLLLGLVIAVPLSVARVYGTWTSYASLFYTELVRGTPLLAQLFVLYYGMDLAGYVPGFAEGVFANPAVWVAIVGFTLNGAAYQAEYIRAALESVDTGQLTAGRAIGLSKLEAIRFVVLPQALRYAIPSWSNEFIYLIKYSSLAAFITVPELFQRSNAIASENFRYTAVFTLTGLLYLALVLSASGLMNRVEDRTAIPGVGSGSGRKQ